MTRIPMAIATLSILGALSACGLSDADRATLNQARSDSSNAAASAAQSAREAADSARSADAARQSAQSASSPYMAPSPSTTAPRR